MAEGDVGGLRVQKIYNGSLIMMIQDTLDYLDTYTDGFKPEIGIVLGSGLGDLADEYNDICIPYSKIPNFAKSNVEGHKGNFVFAEIEGRK